MGLQEAPEHLLASPFSGQNPTTSMAVVPEEADPVPRQTSTADIGTSQQAPQGFQPLASPGNPRSSTPPASFHNAMALASHGPQGPEMPLPRGHVGAGDQLAGVAGGLPPGPVGPMMRAHQSARPGFQDASEHMAGNHGMQHGVSPAQGDTLHQKLMVVSSM